MQEIKIIKKRYCLIYGNGNIDEFVCDKDSFPPNKRSDLKKKELVGYIVEDLDTKSIKYFLKFSNRSPLDFFRIKEFGYYDTRKWEMLLVTKDIFDTYLSYLGMSDESKININKKYLLKKIEREI